MLLYDCEPVLCSLPGAMEAFVECSVGLAVHSASGRVPQSGINEGGCRQPACILITHKDKSTDMERKEENKKENGINITLIFWLKKN